MTAVQSEELVRVVQNPYQRSMSAILTWEPKEGSHISIDVPSEQVPLSTMQVYSEFLTSTVYSAAYRFDVENQAAFIDPAAHGLKPISGGECTPQFSSTAWIAENTSMDFGTVYLVFVTNESRNRRAAGQWIMRMNGFSNGGIPDNLGGYAAWNAKLEFSKLARKVVEDEGVRILEFALSNERLVQNASDEWYRNHAAQEYAATIQRSAHTPYTAVARILKENGMHRSYSHMSVVPMPLHFNVNHTPAVVLKGCRQTDEQRIKDTLEAKGFTRIPVDTPRNMEHRAWEVQVWAKDPAPFNNDINLLHWASKSSADIAASWRPARKANV